MTMTRDDLLIKTFSCFSGINADTREMALQRAEQYCPFASWGFKQDFGIITLAAHFLEMDDLATAQRVAAANNAALGQAPTIPSSFEDSLDRTIYGQQWKELRSTLVEYVIPSLGLYAL